MQKLGIYVVCGLVVASIRSGVSRADMSSTKHNLSVQRGGGEGSRETCPFCHTPHTTRAKVQAWGASRGAVTYKPYSSSTMKAMPGQPTGSSKLCLSCHDGTIAPSANFDGSRQSLPFGSPRADLDTDLSDDHPISITYDSALATDNPQLVDPGSLPDSSIRLDARGQLQCTTCHDAHSSGYPKFLVVDNTYSALCVSCHNLGGWRGSSHESSGAQIRSASSLGSGLRGDRKTGTLAENGCGSCHTVHSAGSHERLLHSENEENNCLPCHNGRVARSNIDSELKKRSTHAVARYRGQHDPAESSFSMPRHVECEDCHNPHAASSARRVAPLVSGPLEGAAGISAQGVELDNAQFEYEVCFRCHTSDSATTIDRDVLQPDIRLKFDQWNPSFHPVAAQGRNLNVPSLLPQWTVKSQINCTDCHANDEGPGAGGSGPRGPHGSAWPHLLEREYAMADGLRESYQRYALCYKCHDQSSILKDESFPQHRLHIVDQRTSCATCHDPHGINISAGQASNHTNLINFSKLEVVENNRQRLEFVDLGTFRGRCSLNCHGREHENTSYP